MKSELELDIRYYETDQMGIVHHSNYIRFFECGRSDMMKKAGLPIEVIEAEGVMLPIVAVECRYRLPAKMGDRIRIVSMIDKVPMAKLVVKSEIYNQHGELLCNGAVTLGFIDSVTRHPVRCPESLAKIIEDNM
jgi:acyl-coA thioester hydrolase, ybgC/ybaW family